jgi:oxygen-independent coproporphyrinogen-3 oxidase
MAGLYIHIPFCGSKCAYCDFYSVAARARMTEFIDALRQEMVARADFLPERRLDTVYVGGGTPSLLSPGQLQGLLDHAATIWDCSAVREITLEANPEDLTDEYIAGLAGSDFNRLSIGVQSFDEGLLRFMNRRHGVARAREVVGAAQKAGFGNITIDLIFGIPGMTPAQWEHTLDEAVGLGVQHISAYHLTIEPGTAFGRMVRGGGLKPVQEAESERQFETLRRRLGEVGFEHYEISNFALPGFRAVHNRAYWSGGPYLGVGPSAHSYDGARRREWVTADLEKYLAAAANGEFGTIYDGETLTDADLFNERVMTSLRCAEGMVDAEITNRAIVEKFVAEGLLVAQGGRIAIPPEKFLLSDYIISALFRE